MNNMIRRIFIFYIYFFILNILIPINISAGNYFIDCDIALENKDFQPLIDYYNSTPDAWPPEMCFRLNKKEFLVTVTKVGTIIQGLYYYNSIDNTFELYRDKNSTCFPGVTIAEEFLGKNNKRYVLMVGGVIGSRFYKIFNLIEKVEGSYPFITYDILSDHWDPVEGLCKNDFPEPTASEIQSYKILNKGTDNVKILFKILEQDCRTKAKRTYTKIYFLKDGIFTTN